MRFNSLTASTAALLAGLVLAGCGSDDEPEATDPADDTEQVDAEGADAGDDPAGDESDADDGEDDDGDATDGDNGTDGDDGQAGWTHVTDEPSNVGMTLPQEAEAEEIQSPTADGGVMIGNSYFVFDSGVEVGFNVLGLEGRDYDLDAGLDGVVEAVDGTLERSDEISVGGYDAVEAEIGLDGGFALLQLIVADDYVVQPLVATDTDNRDVAEDYFAELTGSIEFGDGIDG